MRRACCVEGNAVSAVVFWPTNKEPLNATSFLLICLAVVDNIMLFFYYLLLGVPNICAFSNTCRRYMKVSRPATSSTFNGKRDGRPCLLALSISTGISIRCLVPGLYNEPERPRQYNSQKKRETKNVYTNKCYNGESLVDARKLQYSRLSSETRGENFM